MLLATTVNLDGSISEIELGDEYINSLSPNIEVVSDYRHFSGRDKQNIFTDDEQRAIYTAAYITPDIDILMLVKQMDNAAFTTYSDPAMVKGLEILEAKGLISRARHQEIIELMTAEREV